MKNILLGFATAFLTEKPENIINFAVEYFTKLQKAKERQSKENVDTSTNSNGVKTESLSSDDEWNDTIQETDF